jgi:hypothetical protein
MTSMFRSVLIHSHLPCPGAKTLRAKICHNNKLQAPRLETHHPSHRHQLHPSSHHKPTTHQNHHATHPPRPPTPLPQPLPRAQLQISSSRLDTNLDSRRRWRLSSPRTRSRTRVAPHPQSAQQGALEPSAGARRRCCVGRSYGVYG